MLPTLAALGRAQEASAAVPPPDASSAESAMSVYAKNCPFQGAILKDWLARLRVGGLPGSKKTTSCCRFEVPACTMNRNVHHAFNRPALRSGQAFRQYAEHKRRSRNAASRVGAACASPWPNEKCFSARNLVSGDEQYRPVTRRGRRDARVDVLQSAKLRVSFAALDETDLQRMIRSSCSAANERWRVQKRFFAIR